MSNLVESSVLQLLTDPRVRSLSIGYFEEWMFSSDPYKAYFLCLKNKKFENRVPDGRELVLELHHRYELSQKDCANVLSMMEDAVVVSDPGATVDSLQDFLKDKILSRGIEKLSSGGKDRDDGYADVKTAVNFMIAQDTFTDFSDLAQVKEAREKDYPLGGKIIKSSFNIVNKCCAYHGYKLGDLVMIAAASGSGKTTAMVQEGAHFVNQGFKVAHLFIGDMSEFDAYLKYTSYWTDTGTEEIIDRGFEKYFEAVADRFRNVRIKALPSDTFNVHEIIAKAQQLREKFAFDVLIVDYDANIKETTDSMYESNGITYAHFKSYAAGRCLTLIGSQIKISAWNNEIVRKEDAAESSRKQHHIDMMLGIGLNQDAPLVGTLNLAKMRRGMSNVQVRLSLRFKTSNLKEINADEYDYLVEAYKTAKGKGKNAAILDFDELVNSLETGGAFGQT